MKKTTASTRLRSGRALRRPRAQARRPSPRATGLRAPPPPPAAQVAEPSPPPSSPQRPVVRATGPARRGRARRVAHAQERAWRPPGWGWLWRGARWAGPPGWDRTRRSREAGEGGLPPGAVPEPGRAGPPSRAALWVRSGGCERGLYPGADPPALREGLGGRGGWAGRGGLLPVSAWERRSCRGPAGARACRSGSRSPGPVGAVGLVCFTPGFPREMAGGGKAVGIPPSCPSC